MDDTGILSILLLLCLTFTSLDCQRLEVYRRNTWNTSSGNFYYSDDSFTNPTKHETFCAARNAECGNTNDCSRCYCGHKNETFLSYQQGCLNYSTSYDVLKASQCMHASDDQHALPLPRPRNFENVCHYRIYTQKDVTGSAGECTPTQLTFYDMKYGHESSFNRQFLPKFILTRRRTKNESYYCFKCERNNCSTTELEGHLLKLSINCTSTAANTKSYINTCFIFMIAGTYALKEDTATTRTPLVPRMKKGALNVERLKGQRKEDSFRSIDVFTNPDNQQKFCMKFKSSCYGLNCSKCNCTDDRDTFVSYGDGCLDEETVHEKLGLESCLRSQKDTRGITFIQQQTFKFGTCINLQLSSTLHGNRNEWSCTVENTKSINAFTGHEELFAENPFSANFSTVFNNHLCLQCKSFTCDLSMYSGMLLKLGIKCWNENPSRTFDTCFAFSMDGNLAFNATFPVITKTPSASKSEGIDSSIIAVVVICVLAIFIFFAAFIFLWRRKQQARKEKTSCAHNVVDGSRSNMELATTEVNPTQEYASLGACASKKTPVVKNTTIQNEENLYSKLAHKAMPNDPIYSTTKNDKDNSLYRPEYSVLEAVYAEAENPAHLSKVVGTENIYTKDDIYSVADDSARSKLAKPTNIYEVTNDGVNNPIYGTEIELPNSHNHSCVNNGFSQENSVYQEQPMHEPNKYCQVGDLISSR